MKIKMTTFAFFALLAALSLIAVVYSNQSIVSQTNDWSSLKLKVSAPKQDHLLGEVLQLNFEVINEGSKKIILPGCSTVEGGYMRVHIAYENQPFKEKFGNKSRWQLDGGCNDTTPLKPGQSFRNSATVLWNVKPEVGHLNEEAAKRVAETRIMSDYALPEPGVYSVKAVLHLPGETRPTIESEPIEIIVKKPADEDLEVWNKIKNSKEIAYFIQYNEFLTSKLNEKENLTEKIENIAQKYPRSFLGSLLLQNLEKFRVEEKIRKESLEKTRVKPKN